MKFTRLYPVELLFRGTLGSKDDSLDKDGRIEKVKEWFAIDKPDIIIDTISEEKGLVNTVENDFVYRVKGFSTNSLVR